MQSYLGEIAALLTALCWTVTAMAFESAGKRVGALSLNLIRLLIGLLFLTAFNFFYNHALIPKATGYQWFWLVASGLVGFVLGDLFLFRAFILIGARISMLIRSWATQPRQIPRSSTMGPRKSQNSYLVTLPADSQRRTCSSSAYNNCCPVVAPAKAVRL